MPGGTSRSRGLDPARHYKVGTVVTVPTVEHGWLHAKVGTVIAVQSTLGLTSAGKLTDSECCVAFCRVSVMCVVVPVFV